MKQILCFGDSNTWGYSPDLLRRYNENERWTMLLQSRLADRYRIIEEGQNSRTTVLEDPYEPGKKGLDYLLPCLESHHPDLVLIMLGTNDLKTRFHVSASDISKGAARLVQVVQNFKHSYMSKAPEVLLISPAHVYESDPNKEGFAGAEEKSKQFAHFYQLRAKELGCHFLDAAELIAPCEKEGVHWHADQHVILADKLAELLPELLS
ncbi:G-D-S-L family lipolytic protein [Vibrio sp. UCD-FRSSP16_10]|uniref:SGNH/GDSL hydrolase family protein n=1 Tax=unclassified Vibrio TaxID=2614977 RepID=UPI0007FF24D7|nr:MULTISPECIES: SGNH/GDSL hydrolase family protein [unclassified Vibrio]OBT14011.1 G-D-S-L family lipolytic protein [Vibrio sp. UCD-FRSSP16_30]OBT22892.1 G-D-S-L family lipolytic protein [Vibrio sp. UCD-FRSSP16_10]